jgi:hypothetical protein
MQNDAVVCCIAKNEELYIVEWIKYHLKLGFSRIYIYDNNNNPQKLIHYLSNIIKNIHIKKKITIITYPGKTVQNNAYRHFNTHYGHLHKWVAILDCDEFIVLKNWIPITQFLNQVCKRGSVYLHWRVYGDNGHKHYSNEPVTKRFTACSEELFHVGKSISVCKHINTVVNPHSPVLKPKFLLHDCSGRILTDYVDYSPKKQKFINFAYINHYFGKSFEEWQHKKKRGKADDVSVRTDAEFKNHNFNNVQDASAWKFYIDPNLNFFTK